MLIDAPQEHTTDKSTDAISFPNRILPLMMLFLVQRFFARLELRFVLANDLL
jgi:hypothetical protein